MRLVPAAGLAALALCGPTFAIEDELTGLAVDLPDTFIVEEALPPADYLLSFGVSSASGEPAVYEGESHLCKVSYMPDPANGAVTQEQLNTVMLSPEGRDFMRNMLSEDIDVHVIAPFELKGISGLEFTVTVPSEQGEGIGSVLSFLETPKGRTLVACVTAVDSVDAELEIFRTIRDGVTPPA